MLIRTLGTNVSEILSEIHTFSFKKMHLKMSSAKWRQCCLGLNVLRTRHKKTSEYQNTESRQISFLFVRLIFVFRLVYPVHRVQPINSWNSHAFKICLSRSVSKAIHSSHDYTYFHCITETHIVYNVVLKYIPVNYVYNWLQGFGTKTVFVKLSVEISFFAETQ